jgi:hypothetical protein
MTISVTFLSTPSLEITRSEEILPAQRRQAIPLSTPSLGITNKPKIAIDIDGVLAFQLPLPGSRDG